MTEIQLNYGPIHIKVLSDTPISIPLPQCIDTLPMASAPMTFTIGFHPGGLADALKGKCCIPDSLQEQSQALTHLGIRFLSPEQHCNQWSWVNGQIQGFFPYPTDRFVLRFTPRSSRVELFGNEENLNRVILDILSCYAILPPLHSAAACRDGKATLLLADSGIGKTRMLLWLLDCGYSYLADEEVFWNQERICCVGRIICQKDGRPAIVPKTAQCSCPIVHSVLLYRDMPVQPVLFPLIARQSIWVQDAAPQHPTMSFSTRMETAQKKYIEIVDHAQPFHINHSNFEASATELMQLLQSK